jgi:hypothetical protein
MVLTVWAPVSWIAIEEGEKEEATQWYPLVRPGSTISVVYWAILAYARLRVLIGQSR